MFEYFKTNKSLKAELEMAEQQLKVKEQEASGYKQACHSLLEKSTAELVLENLLNGREVKWFDYRKLTKDGQRAYYNEAQSIIRGQVFNNELNAYMLDVVEEIAKRSRDYNHVQLLRTAISMGQVLRERIKKIQNPDIEPKEEPKDPHSVL